MRKSCWVMFGACCLLGLPAVASMGGQFGTALPDNYFRVLNLSKPVTVAGALIAPSLGDSEGAVLVPIFTHSPADGCLLPGIVCEDWTPLAVGGAMNAGKISFEIAPLINVLPWMQTGLLALVPVSWASTRAMLTPVAGQPVTFSAGPVWHYSQAANKGYYRTFTGLSFHF